MTPELALFATVGTGSNLTIVNLLKKYIPPKFHFLIPFISAVIGAIITTLLSQISDEASKTLLINMFAPTGLFQTYKQYTKNNSK